MDVGLLMLAFPGKAREIAQRTEAAGFTHLALGDTQNLGPETWSQLMLVAGASRTLRIGTGVTNTTTRDVAITASAARAFDDAHLDRFAIVGPVRDAIARFRELAAIGLDFVTIAPGSSDMNWEVGWRSIERIGREIVRPHFSADVRR